MPKIELKPKSPEFADPGQERSPRGCEMPGCACAGEFKAPKHRGLDEHYWFCLDHVREYNLAWDYFSGMSQAEIEEQVVRSAMWDRPTRRYDADGLAEENLRRAAWRTNHFTDKEPPRRKAGAVPPEARDTPEFEALAIMGLEPPIDLNAVKTRYKELAKKHHPDRNPGDKKAEELLKSINMAYTILKMAYQKFETLDQKTA